MFRPFFIPGFRGRVRGTFTPCRAVAHYAPLNLGAKSDASSPGKWANLANVAELVDALDLGSSGVTRGSSTLPIRTKYI